MVGVSMVEVFLPLQMMPGGMMPSAWNWASMWLVLLPTIALVAGILVVLLLLLRNERQPSPVQMTTFSPPQSQPSPSSPKTTIPVEYSKPESEVIGKVLLSLAPTLMDDERRVMDELAKAGGEMLQSNLPEMTGYSKATVSKVIHSLEVRGIIVREPHKWTYWCKVNPRLIERVQQVTSD